MNYNKLKEATLLNARKIKTFQGQVLEKKKRKKRKRKKKRAD